MELFVIVTTQRPIQGGGHVATSVAGTISVKPGATRVDVYRFVMEEWLPENARGGTLLFYSAEPNAIAHLDQAAAPAVPVAGAGER
jgi:hypothetical protein